MDTPRPQLRFARSDDGTRIAYECDGQGPPLLVDTCWLSHLQFDRDSPVWRHWLRDLSSMAHTVRYDERGHGLSDREVTDYSFEQRVADLEAVADGAGLERFALLGMAQGGQVAIAYAARHPERVSRLILHNCAAGSSASADEPDVERVFTELIRVGWARPESEFRRVFTSMMIPDATPEQMSWLDDLQRVSTSAENTLALREARNDIDVGPLLGSLGMPTLVLQTRHDRLSPFDAGRDLAARIPGARLAALESRNHILLEQEPAWQVFLAELRDFIAPDIATTPVGDGDDPVRKAVGSLTRREREVLDLAATGSDNDAIAVALHLSTRTVERHLQNAYAKLGLAGRAARAAAVAAVLGPPTR